MIKLRGWDSVAKKMIYSDSNHEVVPMHFDGNKFYVIEFFDGREVVEYEGQVMLFTGKQDNHKHDVYVNDYWRFKDELWKIVWMDVSMMIHFRATDDKGRKHMPNCLDLDMGSVVGNSYEDNDLLKLKIDE